MIRSVVENLRPGVKIALYVLEDGISPLTKQRLEASWQPYSVSTTWIAPDRTQLQGKVQNRGYAGVPASYFRLLLAELLPPQVREVIYLDVDLIVQDDLAKLSEIPFENHIILAVPDAYAKYTHLARLKRVHLSHEIGFTKTSGYFNAGVLVIDVNTWRAENIGARALELAMTYKDQLLFHDQDALNLVLTGRWKALSPLWNFHELPQSLRHWEPGPFTREERRHIFTAPYIVHFISKEKPWSAVCHQLYKSLFYLYLEHTQWAGWRPPIPPWYVRLYNKVLITPHITMNWCIWRGMIHTFDRTIMRLFFRTLFDYPWAIVGYPLWAMVSWIREQILRLRGIM